MQLTEINTIVHGRLYGNDIAVSSVSIDTRTLRAGELFIAIKGENFDGNDFIVQAEQAGAAAAIVQKNVRTGLSHIVVEDTRLALGSLARSWRERSGVKLVGITGSNGKTTVKEMIAAILAVNAEVLYTRGNLNNDIGVPLTLLGLQPQHQYAVVEMGANHPGEIRYTSTCAKPDVALITNVGPAHIEGFGDMDGVSRAKGEIIESLGRDGTAILNADDRYFSSWRRLAGQRPVISFGVSRGADVRATDICSGVTDNQFVTEFNLHAAGARTAVKMALAGKHNVINALAAAAACLALGIELPQIRQGLERVRPVTGRLQPLLSRQGSIVIDDSYNANPASLKAALEVLMACDGEPWLVLGAFGELGRESGKIHEQMGELVRSMGVARVLATGADAEQTVRAFGEGARFFDSQEGLIAALNDQLQGHEAVLIKGSRAQRMEKVAAALVDNFRK